MRLLILSDVHYASDAEKLRRQPEGRLIRNPLLRLFARLYRHHIWLRDPFSHNHLLDHVTHGNHTPDLVVANGDFTLDSAYVGVSDDAACAGAAACLDKLRTAFGDRLRTTIGDHELGKKSLFGGAGGLRWKSYGRTVGDLGIQQFWHEDVGDFTLVGIASTLVALPVFEPEMLPDEAELWREASRRHRRQISDFFTRLPSNRRIVLFSHDPSALPFLYKDPAIQARLPQFEATIIGHLHTALMFQLSRCLAGMPVLRGMGFTAYRYSSALREARCWKAFKVRLCHSLSGSELLKDGGYLTTRLSNNPEPLKFQFHRVPRGEQNVPRATMRPQTAKSPRAESAQVGRPS